VVGDGLEGEIEGERRLGGERKGEIFLGDDV